MTDIVERIKDAENATHALYNHILQDAREEIERLRIENEALRAEVIHIKEVEFPRKAQAVADGWRGKCERLEAKIEAMEQQEPVATIHINSITGNPSVYFIPGHRYLHHNSSLYALPGAQPALSVPDGWRLVPIVSTHEMKEAGACAGAVYYAIAKDVWSAMLAAAQEAKP